MDDFKAVMPGLASVVTVLFGAGCGMGADPEWPAVDAAITNVALDDCPEFGCGGDNSPLINGTYFHELNMTSTRARRIPIEGAALVDFTKTDEALKKPIHYTLHVEHGRITGTKLFAPTLSGQDLVGAQLVVAIDGKEYAVRIEQVSTVGYWASTTGTPTPTIETYRLDYELLESKTPAWQDLCSNPPGHESRDSMGGHEHDVVVFEGDRIDAATRTVTIDSSGQWFNLGCAGGTLAKMALTGHTIPAIDAGFVTTRAERQTIVKLFSADYCGDGTAFTVAGQPLRWADDHATMLFLPQGGFPTPATTLEARWTEHGAACLGVPRAAVMNSPASAVFPDPGFSNVRSEIVAWCASVGHVIPDCADPTLGTDGYHLVSVNP